jgi:hypothetical protein
MSKPAHRKLPRARRCRAAHRAHRCCALAETQLSSAANQPLHHPHPPAAYSGPGAAYRPTLGGSPLPVVPSRTRLCIMAWQGMRPTNVQPKQAASSGLSLQEACLVRCSYSKRTSSTSSAFPSDREGRSMCAPVMHMCGEVLCKDAAVQLVRSGQEGLVPAKEESRGLRCA